MWYWLVYDIKSIFPYKRPGRWRFLGGGAGGQGWVSGGRQIRHGFGDVAWIHMGTGDMG